MKFQVKPEFAGRSTRCSTCKQPLVVPLEATLAWSPPSSHLDGPLSSLARAGLAGDVTLADPEPSKAANAPRPVAEVLAAHQAGGQRYLLEGEIARGGMGAVLRAVDCDIRREVAVKYLLDQADPRKKARFVEEAQITGQLEHPNIVPIHELGVDARNHLFFSMKMVKGSSLQQVLEQLREEPRVAEKEYTLGRLLNILVGVCNALAYAHSRGVIHRDLKPANIMIGDFGEVYVMDWGLAKVLIAPHPGRRNRPRSSSRPPRSPGPTQERTGSSSGTVKTNRGSEDDKTMDGTVDGHGVVHAAGASSGRHLRHRPAQRCLFAGSSIVRDAELAAAAGQDGRLPRPFCCGSSRARSCRRRNAPARSERGRSRRSCRRWP